MAAMEDCRGCVSLGHPPVMCAVAAAAPPPVCPVPRPVDPPPPPAAPPRSTHTHTPTSYNPNTKQIPTITTTPNRCVYTFTLSLCKYPRLRKLPRYEPDARRYAPWMYALSRCHSSISCQCRSVVSLSTMASLAEVSEVSEVSEVIELVEPVLEWP